MPWEPCQPLDYSILPLPVPEGSTRVELQLGARVFRGQEGVPDPTDLGGPADPAPQVCRTEHAPFILSLGEGHDRVVARAPRIPITHLNRRLSRESWPIAVQPISFMSRSISVCIRPRARSTPAWPAAAKGKR